MSVLVFVSVTGRGGDDGEHQKESSDFLSLPELPNCMASLHLPPKQHPRPNFRFPLESPDLGQNLGQSR